jgi:hypothetical protein
MDDDADGEGLFQVSCRGSTVAEYELLPMCKIANTQPTSGFKRKRPVPVAVIATDLIV